ncbi:hypothetical protein NBRC116598_25200 [Pseudophaeobacter arcticus]|uniref:Uncharacterized protein n=1 Tax=Pseudophaeobacter arcticus TaxID=385492 RepID=A0ABQ0AMI0_9RHOB
MAIIIATREMNSALDMAWAGFVVIGILIRDFGDPEIESGPGLDKGGYHASQPEAKAQNAQGYVHCCLVNYFGRGADLGRGDEMQRKVKDSIPHRARRGP